MAAFWQIVLHFQQLESNFYKRFVCFLILAVIFAWSLEPPLKCCTVPFLFSNWKTCCIRLRSSNKHVDMFFFFFLSVRTVLQHLTKLFTFWDLLGVSVLRSWQLHSVLLRMHLVVHLDTPKVIPLSLVY